jgi:hypothetical protein
LQETAVLEFQIFGLAISMLIFGAMITGSRRESGR